MSALDAVPDRDELELAAEHLLAECHVRPEEGAVDFGVASAAGWLPIDDRAQKAATSDYPVHALPRVIREAVEEAAEYFQAPNAVIAASALSVVSVAAQGLVDVWRDSALSGPTSLFLLTVAESGERKSACDRHFSSVLRRWEVGASEKLSKALHDFEADDVAWRAKHAGLEDAIKRAAKLGHESDALEENLRSLEATRPEKPMVPQLLRGDDTPESLAWSLTRHWPSAGLLSSEAGAVFGSHGMGRDSVMRNLALLSTLWDGGVHHVGRRTSESFTVGNVRLTLGLMVQESALRSFIGATEGLARGMGFLARFLVAWPASTQGRRQYRAPRAFDALKRFEGRVTKVLDSPLRFDPAGGLTFSKLSMSGDGKSAWIEWHDQFEARLGAGSDLHDVRDVASKAAENVARLAAVFHVIEVGRDGAIGAEHVRSAGRIVDWHLSEARRFFGELALPPELVDAGKLEAWLIDRIRSSGDRLVSTRSIQQFGPARLRKAVAIEAALAILKEEGRARLVQVGRKKFVEINPELIPIAGARPISDHDVSEIRGIV